MYLVTELRKVSILICSTLYVEHNNKKTQKKNMTKYSCVAIWVGRIPAVDKYNHFCK